MNEYHPRCTHRALVLDWERIAVELNAGGSACISGLLLDEECDTLKAMYPQGEWFRSHIHMGRHGFGQGEYKYFKYPLPDRVAELRTGLYPELAKIANDWNIKMNIEWEYPSTHQRYLDLCHSAGQIRPTPLLLQYTKGDYNYLHQDLYGERVFPLQVAILLSEPEQDFLGGEFVLTEQRPRRQTRAEVLSLKKGDAVIFAVSHRPVQGNKGHYRVNMRHGVSKIHHGNRHTLGIIFHDAL